MDLQHTLGPSFSSSRVLRFGDLSQDEQESFVRFFAEQKVSFFRDLDGSYVANVRLYDPSVIDMSATNSTAGATSRGNAGKGSNKGGKRDGTMNASGGLSSSILGEGGLGLEYGVYNKFTALIAPRDTIKPKARPLSWLMRLIEEIYDQRYAKDTADLRGEAEAGADSGEAAGSTPFPQFVVDFFSKRYGLRSLIDQTCWDLLYNLHAARKEHLEAETFARFLEGAYDADDLLFYLYVRSVVQKELGVSFRARWSELGRAGAEGGVANSGSPAPLYLSVRECAIVSRVVFGSESDPLYRTFMAMLDRHLVGKKPSSSAAGSSSSNASSAGSVTTAFGARGDTRKIEVTQFLHLALVEYVETRPRDDEELASLSASAAAKTAAASSSSSASSSSRNASPARGGYDDLQAAGLSVASSSSMSRSPNSNAGGNSSSDKLLREAEATYGSRLQAAAPTLPPPAPAASSSASSGSSSSASSAGGIAAALLRKSPTFFDDLGEGMHQANEAYLDKALLAAASLPQEVQAQIRTEVQAQLEGKLDAILATTIKATQSGSSTGSSSRDALAAHFGRVMAAAAGEAPMTQGSTINSFCEAVLAQPEVQETVAPLISLLVTYAGARLQEAVAAGGGGSS